MKSLHIPKSFDFEGNQDICFFAEVLNERLFIHAPDSFKITTLNTVTRISELIFLTEHLIENSKPIKSIAAITSELLIETKKDPTISAYRNKNLIYEIVRKIDQLASSGKDENAKIILNNARLLMREASNYAEMLENEIKEALLQYSKTNNNAKDKIWKCTNNYIISTISSGYSIKHVRHMVQETILNYIYKPRNYESKEAAINSFFDSFKNKDSKKYTVYTKVRGLNDEISNSLLSLKAHYQELDPKKDKKYSTFLGEINDGYLISRRDDIEALDPYSAHEKAERYIEAIMSIYQYATHQNVRLPIEKSIVIDESDRPYIVREKYNPMLLGLPIKGDDQIAKEISELARTVTSIPKNQSKRLINAITYHKAALDSPNQESRLVNLWAALEGLLPQPSGEKARIEHYLDLITPPLVLSYFERKLSYLAKNVMTQDVGAKNIISKININGTLYDKFVALICCEENNSIASELLSHLNKKPLLSFFLFNEHCNLKTADAIFRTISNHKSRIRNQISRIYINRNMIMHSAQSYAYKEQILENLHGYFDIVISSVVHLISKNSKLNVETSILKLQHCETLYLENLQRNKSSVCSTDNLHALLFGLENPILGLYSKE